MNQLGGARLCLGGQAQRVDRATMRGGSDARRAGEPLRLVEDDTAARRLMGTGPFQADAEWNAGDMGCGELVLELRLRLEAMSSGQIFKLCARDAGAPEDLPAWCRLTGHCLLRAEPPTYWIQRKE